VQLQWEVALDAAFSTLVKSGTVTADPANDSTVKVDVTGLQPATPYFYRFKNGSVVSETGRTRTLPTGSVQQVKLGVFSCAAFPLGQFHVYNHASNRSDLDAALMLGDYIYENGLSNVEQLAAAPSAARSIRRANSTCSPSTACATSATTPMPTCAACAATCR
jgi:phosphodiesterase/alkaline phosphatase D-like protein